VADFSQEFYPQDGGKSWLESKVRHCHPTYRNFLLMPDKGKFMIA